MRRDSLNDRVREIPLESGFVVSKFRESRDADGHLTHLSGPDRLGSSGECPFAMLERRNGAN